MDILVRGGDDITRESRIRQLQNTEEHWLWRGQNKPSADSGDKVYFYKDRAIVGYCLYGGFEWKEERNIQRKLQKGMAILVRGPFHEFEVSLPSNIKIEGPWRWRYVYTVPGLQEKLDSALGRQ